MLKFFKDGTCLIVEDQQKTRDFLRDSLVSSFPDIKVVALRNIRETSVWLEQYKENSEGSLKLALIDLGLPDGSGVELVHKISLQEPAALIVVVTIYNDDAHLFDALAAGASGYVLKDEAPNFIAGIIEKIYKGEPPLSPSIAHRLLAHFRTPVTLQKTEAELTSREKETLTLLAKGLTVSETAMQMGLSAQTVAGYVKIIYQKLHVSNRAEATREAIRRGLA